MKVDAQTRQLLDQVNAGGNPPLYELSVADARAGLKQMTLAMDAPAGAIRQRHEVMIPGPAGAIPVRIYWPEIAGKAEKLPMLLLYHGGGFALGDLDTHENVARYYCQHAGLIVISVDYRLAPEHKFPRGVEDCYAALCWAAENAGELNGDVDRIGVSGDSAGGNLSAVMCQLARQRMAARNRLLFGFWWKSAKPGIHGSSCQHRPRAKTSVVPSSALTGTAT